MNFPQTVESKIRPTRLSASAIPPIAANKITLSNGMMIITCEDHSAPVSSVQVWAKTGSIHEADKMGAGLSHILEHMLFKGTEKRGVSDIARQVESFGGYINAYTTWDRTVYHIDIPSEGGKPGTASGTEMAIDILADAIMNSTLPPKDYALEQKVILREMAMGRDNPDRQATELFFSTIYRIHPARNPVIGYEDVYRTLTREDVMGYYKGRYVPNNLIVVVVGDIHTETVRAQITKLMGSWPRKALAPNYIPEEPIQISPRIVVEQSRTASQQTRLHLGYSTCDFRHPDAAPLEMLAMIAGHGFSSHLYQHLREEEELVHEIDAWSYTPTWRGLFGISAIVDPEKAIKARDAILTDLEAYKKAPVTKSEIQKALKIALSSHLASRKTMSGLASELASNEILTGDLTYSDKYLQQLQRVTAADIQRVAKTYFRPTTLSLVMLQPKSDVAESSSLEKKTVETAIEKSQLANGLTVLTKEDHHLPFVELRLVLKSGLLFEEADQNGISQLTSKLLLKGTRTRNAERLVREIESVGGSISPYSGANSMGLLVEVMQGDLPLACEVLSDIILNSTFTAEHLAREKEAQIADIRQEHEQPVKIAMQNARAKLFGKHPYGMANLGTEKTVSSITREQILRFWKQVAVPSNMVLSVFGDVEPSAVHAQIKKFFNPLAKAAKVQPKTAPPTFSGGDRVIDHQDKEQGVVVIAYPGIDIKDPDRAAIELMNAALSGMGSRLFLRLRDELALCYYVGVNELVGIHRGFIYFYIGTDPARIDKAEKEIRAEIEKLRKNGITQEELERARNGLLGEKTMQKQNLGELALTSALDELYNLGFDYAEKLEKDYLKVTSSHVQAVAKKYLDRPPVVSVVRPRSLKKQAVA